MRRFDQRLLVFVLGVAIMRLAAPLAAQASHPNFAGTWTLDPAKTVIDGPLPAPNSARYTIAQVGDSITTDIIVSAPDGDQVLRRIYRIDGRVWTNTLNYQGIDMVLSSTLRWQDSVLVIHTTSEFSGTPVEQNETWTLAGDGKTLTITTNTNAAGTYYAGATLVFVKK